ncbi:MAG: hypothetical protein U0587_09055 [Candidatus Binatia bacterium]
MLLRDSEARFRRKSSRSLSTIFWNPRVYLRAPHEGSTEIKKLQVWRQATGLADLEENISYLSAQIPRLRDRRADLFSSLDRQLAKLSSLYNERRDVKEKLAIVEEKLGDPTLGEDAVRLRERYQRLLRDRGTHRARQQLVEDEIRKNESDRADVNKQIKKLEVQNERGAVLKRQLEAVERVSDALDAVAQIQKDDVRSALDKQIREIWNDAAIKDYDASVTENYRLLLANLSEDTRSQFEGFNGREAGLGTLVRRQSCPQSARERRETAWHQRGRTLPPRDGFTVRFSGR